MILSSKCSTKRSMEGRGNHIVTVQIKKIILEMFRPNVRHWLVKEAQRRSDLEQQTSSSFAVQC